MENGRESKLSPRPQRLRGLAPRRIRVLRDCRRYPSPIGRISLKSMVGRQGPRQCETRGHSGRDFGDCCGHNPTNRVQRQHRLLANCQFDSMIPTGKGAIGGLAQRTARSLPRTRLIRERRHSCRSSRSIFSRSKRKSLSQARGCRHQQSMEDLIHLGGVLAPEEVEAN